VMIGMLFATQDTVAVTAAGYAFIIVVFVQMAFFAFTGERRKLGRIMLIAGASTFVFYAAVGADVVATATSMNAAIETLVAYAIPFIVVSLVSTHLHLIERVPKDTLTGVRPWFVKKA
ncbi:MAG: hypothetical protein ACREAO_08380, partial [Nitrososphaera sp.]